MWLESCTGICNVLQEVINNSLWQLGILIRELHSQVILSNILWHISNFEASKDITYYLDYLL